MRGRDWFNFFKPALKLLMRLLSYAPVSMVSLMLTLCRYLPTRFGVGVRYVLIGCLVKSVGDNVAIYEGVHLHHLQRVELGNNISVHPMCYIIGYGGLRIGDNVSIAHGCSILTLNHDYHDPTVPIRDADVTPAEVMIGNDVWIGAGARILAGVTIGDRVVIGANAVVTKDIPSYSIAVGSPARVIRTLDAV